MVSRTRRCSGRDTSHTRRSDPLDGSLRWALEERVTGATPPSQIWGQITASVDRGAVPNQAQWHLDSFLNGVNAWVSEDR